MDKYQQVEKLVGLGFRVVGEELSIYYKNKFIGLVCPDWNTTRWQVNDALNAELAKIQSIQREL